MIGPCAAFGNSTGDRQMLEYTGAGDGARLAMLVLHDDPTREYAYGPGQGLPPTKVGTFTQALYDEAKQKGWTVISMKNDWKRIFAFEEGGRRGKDPISEPRTAKESSKIEARNSKQIRNPKHEARKRWKDTMTSQRERGTIPVRRPTTLMLTIGGAALLALAVGCATTQQTTGSMLSAAGFKIVPASTPEQQARLRTLPAQRVSRVQRDGKEYFVYPDVTQNVLYVGRNAQYQQYQRLREQNQLAQEQFDAGMARDQEALWPGVAWD